MANGSPVVNIDMPSEWPIGSGEVTQIGGVLTEAGKKWRDAKLQEPAYSSPGSSTLIDPFAEDPLITNVDGVLIASFDKAAQATEEQKGGEGVWFSGPDARTRAYADAMAAGYRYHEIELISRAGELSWQTKGSKRPADQTWTIYEADNGSIFMYDKEAGPGTLIPLVEASSITPTGPGVKEIPGSIPNADGSVTKFFSVTDANGNTTMQKVTERETITKDSAINLEEGGRLIPRGNGTYDYVADPAEPFTTSPSDVIALPNQNGSLIKTSANQYQFVRDTFDPGRKVDATGREYLQQIDGSWSELAPRFEPGFIERADGMNLFQQRSGQVTQLSAATMDDVITQALIDGDVDKALAFQDFRDRPTAQEAFNTALEFARSPADQVLISSIARGEQTVQPPPAGTIQRVGPQADFLVQAYEDFQRRTQAGRAPTGEEISAATEDPTLQARLESIANKDRREQEKHDLFIQGEESKQRRADELFTQQTVTKTAESAAKVAVTTGGTGGTENTEPGAEAVVETDDGATTEADALRAEAELEVRQAIEANQKIWDSLSEDQKALFGGSGDTVPENFKSLNQGQVNLHLARAKLPPAPSPDVSEVQTPPVEQPVVLDIPEAAPRAPEISSVGEEASYQPVTGASLAADVTAGRMEQNEADTIAASLGTALPNVAQQFNITPTPAPAPAPAKETEFKGYSPPEGGFRRRAGGGTVQPGEITVVGEQGPEIAMMPPGTHILPLGKATKQDIKAAQATGRAYQQGGIVFGELPFGIRQLQAGRPITPSRGYLSQAAGLTLPSAQALSNLTPESRDVYFDLARQAGIPSRAFGQELQTAMPGGTRLPTSRMLPLGRRGVR